MNTKNLIEKAEKEILKIKKGADFYLPKNNFTKRNFERS